VQQIKKRKKQNKQKKQMPHKLMWFFGLQKRQCMEYINPTKSVANRVSARPLLILSCKGL